jgi:hypothetical protein
MIPAATIVPFSLGLIVSGGIFLGAIGHDRLSVRPPPLDLSLAPLRDGAAASLRVTF